MKKIITYILIMLAICGGAVAISTSNLGNVNVNGNFTVLGDEVVLNVTSATINGSIYPTTTGTFELGSSTILWSALYSLNLTGNITWSDIYGHPSACPADTYITHLGDSITCSAVDNATGDFNVVGNLTVEGKAVIHNEVIDIGIVGSTRNSSISVSKTVTVSDSSTVEIQNIWNYTAEGAGETALQVYAQTAPNNPYNVAGNMRGLEAYSEHLADTTVAGATAMAGIIRTGGGTISQSDAVLAFTSGVGGNITKANGFLASGLVFSDSVIDYTGLRIEELGNYGGTFSSNTGVMVEDVTVGTKNTGVLIGTDTAPEGNYSIYSNTTSSSYFGGNILLDNDANVTWKNGASISVNSTCIILTSPAGTGTHAVCD